MQRRTPLALLALLAVVACTGPDITAVTQPLAPPDTFPPTTTDTTQPETTTAADIDRASIYHVDPTTLEAIPGLDPIPVGDWFWGATSDNGRWLALYAGDDTGVSSDLQLIDVVDWETVSTWDFVTEQPLYVTDDGAIYSLEGSSPSIKLSRRTAGRPEAIVVAQLPDDFFSGYEIELLQGHAAILGYRSVDGRAGGEASIVTVDVSNGAITEISLPGVDLGLVGEVDIDETYPGLLDFTPAVVWDHQAFKALVVHANKDVVTEVDLATKEVTDHLFGPEASAWGQLFAWLMPPARAAAGAYASTRRMAVMSADRSSLYIATMLGDISVDEAGWSSVHLPTGIITLDTAIWQVVDRLDAPISEIFLSPTGHRLLATGYGYTQSRGSYEPDGSGFFVIDPTDLDVISRYDPGQPTEFHWGFSFSRDARLGYVTATDTQTEIDVIDLETGVILNTRIEPEIQMFGDIGVLGEVQRSP